MSRLYEQMTAIFMKAISSLKFPLLEVRVEAGGGGGLQLNWAGDVLVPEEKRKRRLIKPDDAMRQMRRKKKQRSV